MNQPVSDLRLIWLQTFLATQRVGSLAKAAKEVGCSQPMAGRYVRQLEDWYGATLFADAPGGKLTAEGRKLTFIAQSVLSALEHVRNSATDDKIFRTALGTDEDDVVDAEFTEVEEGEKSQPRLTWAELRHAQSRLDELRQILSLAEAHHLTDTQGISRAHSAPEDGQTKSSTQE